MTNEMVAKDAENLRLRMSLIELRDIEHERLVNSTVFAQRSVRSILDAIKRANEALGEPKDIAEQEHSR